MPLPPVRPPAFRLRLACALVIAGTLAASPAWADGETNVLLSDGVSHTYRHVGIRLAGGTLFLSSPDGRDVLEVTTGACSYTGELQRCLPYAATLHRHGDDHAIALMRGSVFVNLSAETAHLPHSSQGVGPRGVLVHLHTQRGTFISAEGTLDAVR